MRIDIITLFPEMIEGFFEHSIVKRAKAKGKVEIHLHQLRDYSVNKQKSVDDYPYGGGAGMVMQVDPIARCIESLQAERHYDEIIYTTPDARTFNQAQANEMSMLENVMILCGHYKGVDQRVRDHFVTREISLGDFVLSGGELVAAVISDAIVRLIPGVLTDESSALSDSFQNSLLSPPVYTRPASYRGWEVPPVLLSGNDREIALWNYEQALQRTRQLRPDLLKENHESL